MSLSIWELISKDGIGKAEGEGRVMQGRRVGGALRALLNCRNLSAECAVSLHDGLLVPAIMCGCETLLFLCLKRYIRIRTLGMDNFHGIIGIRNILKHNDMTDMCCAEVHRKTYG